MEKLAAVFGFLADQPEAHDTFLRLLHGLFERMQTQKLAYCNNAEANRMYFAFVRLQHYNGLLGRQRNKTYKPTIARALASLNTELMIRVIQAFNDARRAYLSKKEKGKDVDVSTEVLVDDPSRMQISPVKPTPTSFNDVAMALSLQLDSNLGIDNGEGYSKNMENTAPVNSWLSRNKPEESKWSKPLVEGLCNSIDTWNREKFVQKQESETFGSSTNTFFSVQAHGPALSLA
jgi:hypothetical protein